MSPGETMASLGIAHHDPAHWPDLAIVPYLCPDFALVLSAGFVLSFAEIRRQSRARDERWIGALARSPLVAFAGGAASGIVLSTLLVCFAPRYMAQAVPLAYALLAYGLFGGAPGRRRRRWKLGILATVVLINLANREGRFYRQIDEGPGATHSEPEKARERSHEYERFLAANQEAARMLERDFAEVPLLVTAPFGHMLGEPRFGYVTRPLAVACAGMRRAVYPYVRGLDETRPEELRAADPIYVRDRYCDPSTIPPPEPGDEILFDDRLSPPLTVYRKRWRDGPPAEPERIEPWYRERGWDGHTLVDRVRQRLMTLRTVGRAEQGETELRGLVESLPGDAPLRVLWIGLLMAEGKTAEAENELLLATAAFPAQAWFPGSLGKLLLARNRMVEAVGPIEDAARLDPKAPEILVTLAELRERQGRLADAAAIYETVLSLPEAAGTNRLEWRFRLASARHRSGGTSEALELLDSILTDRSEAGASEGGARYRARNLLAWILATDPDDRLRDGPRGVKLAEENLRSAGGADPQAWDTLAAAYAESGRFTDAIEAQKKCLEGLSAASLPARIDEARARLDLYSSGQRYRDAIERRSRR